MRRGVGGPRGRVARHGGTRQARVEPREGRLAARAATRDLVGFPPNRGAASGRLDTEAVLQDLEGLGPIPGAKLGQVGTGLRRNLAVDAAMGVGDLRRRRHR